jgi:translation initiation factor IF-3
LKKQPINHDIKARIVNLVIDGSVHENINKNDALSMAKEKGLDLVQVNNLEPNPTCKFMDYGKIIYEKNKQQKKSKKKATVLKEIKFRPNTDVGDINTKVNKINDFLDKSNEVKLVVQFKGRENAHKDIGFNVIERVLSNIDHSYQFKQEVQSQGRFITCVLKCA